MLTFDTLLEEAVRTIPEFNIRYNEELNADNLDNNSGKHTVFSYNCYIIN